MYSSFLTTVNKILIWNSLKQWKFTYFPNLHMYKICFIVKYYFIWVGHLPHSQFSPWIWRQIKESAESSKRGSVSELVMFRVWTGDFQQKTPSPDLPTCVFSTWKFSFCYSEVLIRKLLPSTLKISHMSSDCFTSFMRFLFFFFFFFVSKLVICF